jgi:hypothetical protein
MRQARVGAQHLGLFAFKGCGTVEVVTFLTDTAPVLAQPSAEQSKGAKGILVSPAFGPVVGLQECPIMLPGVLLVLRKACRVAAAVVAAEAGVSAFMGGA